jgi:ribosome production factor 1
MLRDWTRYAFRSPEKVALQEIGPRFTLKLRWLKRGIPAVRDHGAAPPKPQIEGEGTEEEAAAEASQTQEAHNQNTTEDDEDVSPLVLLSPQKIIKPPKEDVYEWQWKVCAFLHNVNILLTFSIAGIGDQ